MSSVGEVRRRLHRDFVDNLYSIFSPGLADKILQGIGNERLTTLRVNVLKSDISSIMRYFNERGLKYDRVPWYGDALVLKNTKVKDIEELDIYREGLIYLQSLSSMIPPLVLSPKSGERILDITAAPGSKTTQISALMNNKGYILANDIDKIRVERLKYNLMMQGAQIAEVQNRDGTRLGGEYEESFDRVLLDAPCSGEGRFTISKPASFKGWSIRDVERLVKLQKKLFESSYKALKKGGIMIYSTCTLNTKENEEVIKWASSKFNFEILECRINIQGSIPAFNMGVRNLERAMRIIPTKNMEGFFICKIKKI